MSSSSSILGRLNRLTAEPCRVQMALYLHELFISLPKQDDIALVCVEFQRGDKAVASTTKIWSDDEQVSSPWQISMEDVLRLEMTMYKSESSGKFLDKRGKLKILGYSKTASAEKVLGTSELYLNHLLANNTHTSHFIDGGGNDIGLVTFSVTLNYLAGGSGGVRNATGWSPMNGRKSSSSNRSESALRVPVEDKIYDTYPSPETTARENGLLQQLSMTTKMNNNPLRHSSAKGPPTPRYSMSSSGTNRSNNSNSNSRRLLIKGSPDVGGTNGIQAMTATTDSTSQDPDTTNRSSSCSSSTSTSSSDKIRELQADVDATKKAVVAAEEERNLLRLSHSQSTMSSWSRPPSQPSTPNSQSSNSTSTSPVPTAFGPATTPGSQAVAESSSVRSEIDEFPAVVLASPTLPTLAEGELPAQPLSSPSFLTDFVHERDVQIIALREEVVLCREEMDRIKISHDDRERILLMQLSQLEEVSSSLNEENATLVEEVERWKSLRIEDDIAQTQVENDLRRQLTEVEMLLSEAKRMHGEQREAYGLEDEEEMRGPLAEEEAEREEAPPHHHHLGANPAQADGEHSQAIEHDGHDDLVSKLLDENNRLWAKVASDAATVKEMTCQLLEFTRVQLDGTSGDSKFRTELAVLFSVLQARLELTATEMETFKARDGEFATRALDSGCEVEVLVELQRHQDEMMVLRQELVASSNEVIRLRETAMAEAEARMRSEEESAQLREQTEVLMRQNFALHDDLRGLEARLRSHTMPVAESSAGIATDDSKALSAQENAPAGADVDCMSSAASDDPSSVEDDLDQQGMADLSEKQAVVLKRQDGRVAELERQLEAERSRHEIQQDDERSRCRALKACLMRFAGKLTDSENDLLLDAGVILVPRVTYFDENEGGPPTPTASRAIRLTNVLCFNPSY